MYIVCRLWLGLEGSCAKRRRVVSGKINMQTAHYCCQGSWLRII